MKNFSYYTVVPKLPEPLKPLQEISQNMWWSWQTDAIELFYRIDQDLWNNPSIEHNPIRLIGALSWERLEELAEDEGFLNHMNSVYREFQHYMTLETWYSRLSRDWQNFTIAYFSLEYGIHESLPIYSGGLGILSGDHLKSASELGIPLVGVGLLYRHGYFRQSLNADGWQHERYPENDFHNMPISLVRDKSGSPIKPYIDYPFGRVFFQIWQVAVGRITLYLLDACLDENAPEGREITKQLYGGDEEMRLKQEVLLGIGGIRALKSIGINPTVCHMNEGHSGFMPLERIRYLMHEQSLGFDAAFEAVYATNIFTTHTPVPAGNDRFTAEQVMKYLGKYIKELGIDAESFLGLGRENPDNKSELFCMTVIAIRMAGFKNGVSQLHGSVSRQMWKNIWPTVPEQETPIEHITNGVHVLSWLSRDMKDLLERYLGERWVDDPYDKEIWKKVRSIPDPELWHAREGLRRRLITFVRKRLKESLQRRGASKSEMALADEVLDPKALTIGFARRFATYKRGNLLFNDLDRLRSILADESRPVQFIFAGKAHPRDEGGKRIIKEIIHTVGLPEFRHKIVFLEDYDISLGRKLVQGVDLWLNNPRRPLEACGTSGMKVTPNAGLNMSILDGWWEEGYDPELGWSIGGRETYDDLSFQDEVESNSIYSLLENEVLPAFYTRSADGIPRKWLQMVKEAMVNLLPVFNTNNMVENYTTRYYLNASINWNQFEFENFAHARHVATWNSRVIAHWSSVSVRSVTIGQGTELGVGELAPVVAEVNLGNLTPQDVIVEAYYGRMEHTGRSIQQGQTQVLNSVEHIDGNLYRFHGMLPCPNSGRFACTLRVINNSPLDIRRLDITPLIWW
ncbi:alpha-glucan family phosphorylase [Desulfurispirillum indicum]|uniref:alpha-glucan family phosphorylase n=1 Tax=Desulfurispirillum indicum TaxID=936456 RepID=UPI001CFB5FB0|nr:alpha-glucan family phosphorylase [Desulfurispirillum indicum]UCZ57220.1 alpha-glucan family phosphorylase [Desulfurispirillum indicum]